MHFILNKKALYSMTVCCMHDKYNNDTQYLTRCYMHASICDHQRLIEKIIYNPNACGPHSYYYICIILRRVEWLVEMYVYYRVLYFTRWTFFIWIRKYCTISKINLHIVRQCEMQRWMNEKILWSVKNYTQTRQKSSTGRYSIELRTLALLPPV